MLYAILRKMLDEKTYRRTKDNQEETESREDDPIMKDAVKQMCLDILRYESNFFSFFLYNTNLKINKTSIHLFDKKKVLFIIKKLSKTRRFLRFLRIQIEDRLKKFDYNVLILFFLFVLFYNNKNNNN